MSGDSQGYLWVADISGYTGYLNESELKHAEGTLTDLLQLLIEKPGSPLIVSKLEGDAVFAYGLDDEVVGGQTFVELVEDTYVEFRRTIDLMVLNNSCQCNACANVSALDLKFVIHHGEFRTQKIGDFVELVGSDVALVHRLMKNSVVEQTGVAAYCLYTDQAWQRLEVDGIDGLINHREHVPDFGDVNTWIQDLTSVYEKRRTDSRIELSPDETLFTISADLPMSPGEVWDYLTAPEYRKFLSGSDSQVITDRTGGRTTNGSIYQCYHGKQVVPQVILEWDPFRKVVTEETWLKPWKATSLAIAELTETESGTRLDRTFGRIKASTPTLFLGKMMMNTVMKGIHKKFLATFVEAVEADWRGHSQAGQGMDVTEDMLVEAAREGLQQRVT